MSVSLRLGGSIRVRSRSCLRTVDTSTPAEDDIDQAKMIPTNGNLDNCLIAPFLCQECRLLLGEAVRPNQTSYNLCLFAGALAAGGGGVKRELIESCPDLPEHLDVVQEDCYLDQQEYPRLEGLGCEKEDVAKEEIQKILSKVDERKKRGRKPVKNQKNEDEDEEDEWNVDDCTDLEADAYSGRKKLDNRRSSNIFRCPHTECGATFTKEVFQ